MKASDVGTNAISRRRFLIGAARSLMGGALVSSGLMWPTAGSKAFASDHGDKPMDYLKYATFSRLMNETFEIRLSPTEKIPVRLIEAVERDSDNEKGVKHQESFSILFQGPGDKRLDQGTYRFHHPRTFEFALFIVPVGIDDAGYHYEAVINRLKT